MPRPPKSRWVSYWPEVTHFKPAGVPLRDLEEVVLQVDELEALRLKDLNDLDQVDCAREMGVSQSTLQRMLAAARAKVTEALIMGKSIRIEGGPAVPSPQRPAHPISPPAPGRGPRGPGRGHGRGHGGGRGLGPRRRRESEAQSVESGEHEPPSTAT